ncbi:MAG: mechanosensitive ion channel [Planctomycetes bacterium]|nr:mechanosensitive ion channel [Planctomycetota bacterium]
MNPSINLETITSWRQALEASVNQALTQVITWTPKLVGMILVLVLGYFVARVLDRIVSALAQSLGLERAAESSGLTTSMRQVGIERTVPWIFGRLVFWLTMCVFLTAAFNILGMQAVSTAMDKVVAYIPHVLLATVVVVVGLLVATFLRGVIATGADRIGLSYAEHLANGIYYVLALMTALAALDQLGVEFGLLQQMILIAFAAVALGFGLSFGLGGRDVMAGILAGYYTRQRLHAGDHVTVGTLEGTVREVGPVATVIETMEDGLVNRHSVPNTKMLNEAVR